MDFSLTEEQQMMRDAMEKFCKNELNKEYVKWMDENVDFPPDEGGTVWAMWIK
jgi:acyl-CoA dehydrogenase